MINCLWRFSPVDSCEHVLSVTLSLKHQHIFHISALHCWKSEDSTNANSTFPFAVSWTGKFIQHEECSSSEWNFSSWKIYSCLCFHGWTRIWESWELVTGKIAKQCILIGFRGKNILLRTALLLCCIRASSRSSGVSPKSEIYCKLLRYKLPAATQPHLYVSASHEY